MFLLLGIANPIQTFAESSSNQQDINAEINQLEKTYGFETVDLNDSTETINPTELEFDTTEEFEEFVKGLQEEDEIEVNEEISVSEDEENSGGNANFCYYKEWLKTFELVVTSSKWENRTRFIQKYSNKIQI
ncbi:hypothetical protein ASG97_12465 [Bacillus sp. Soil745]|nr:hypothetical protein ASG97_12465 [Bacillus sp. Soil745]